MQINSEKLIMLRKQKDLSAEALAEASGVGRATITRIENGRTATQNRTTVERLCKALRCKPEDLATPPEKVEAGNSLSSRRATPYGMRIASQNALALIAARYDEKPETILELAPLLFDIFARESLIARREALTELRSRRAAIGAMSNKFPHLSGRFTVDWEAEDFDDREQVSIDRDDIRGEFVHADSAWSDSFYPNEFDEEGDNPFVFHLKARCERLGACGYEAPRVDVITRSFGPVYDIGLPEAAKLAGGDDDLAQAIVAGWVPVASIPKELLNEERLADRQKWLREKQSESKARSAALFAELGLAEILGEEAP